MKSRKPAPAPEESKIKRCAIYTRKSNEEGLNKEHNTLHAQRERAENYILSQSDSGWRVIPENYDDGGFSGGNIERPALKRMMDDIQNGRIDIVVVYKVDRISRSLMDFYDLLKVFEKHGVEFVSVTQNFDTSQPMGKLMLNMLLSFAQFEREVIRERILDKFELSKQKGIFMGGSLPLGYRVESRKLYIVPEEAKTVRHIYERFVAIKSITRLQEELNLAGIRTKYYISGSGNERGGQEMDKQYLYRILKNPIYIGKIQHKGKIYEGQHEAIISQELFDKAQETFKECPVARGNYTKNKNPALLRGLVKCTCCDAAMTATAAKQHNRVYRYYTATTVNRKSYEACRVGSVPMAELDALVVAQLRSLIQSPEILTRIQRLMNDARITDFGFEELRKQIKDFDGFWKAMTALEQQRVAELLVKRVDVGTDEVRIDLRLDGFTTLINQHKVSQHKKGENDAPAIRRGRKHFEHSPASSLQAA
jgi:site-specific DNA recombinase